MTANELKKKMASDFGFNPWPKELEVDAETYGNVCQAILDWTLGKANEFPEVSDCFRICVAVGPNNGIMFQNVELRLKGHVNDIDQTRVQPSR